MAPDRRSLSSVCCRDDDLTSGLHMRPSDYGGRPRSALMRGNAAPRTRAIASIFARWSSLGQCDRLKCLLPDNWSGNFAAALDLLQCNKLMLPEPDWVCATVDAFMIAADYLKRIAAWSSELNDREIEVARAGIVEKSYRANEF